MLFRSTFNSTSGKEGPARAALTLILHRSDAALGNPVDRRSVGLGVDLDVRESAAISWSLTKHLFVFCSAQVRELVVTGGPSGVGGVVLLDELVGQIKISEALAELFN